MFGCIEGIADPFVGDGDALADAFVDGAGVPVELAVPFMDDGDGDGDTEGVGDMDGDTEGVGDTDGVGDASGVDEGTGGSQAGYTGSEHYGWA